MAVSTACFKRINLFIMLFCGVIYGFTQQKCKTIAGSGTAPKAEVNTTATIYQKQFASMLAKMLGYDFKSEIAKQ
jgi:hypothetical protein